MSSQAQTEAPARRLTDEELAAKMREHNAQVVNTIVGLFTAPPRRMSEGSRLDAWKALRAEFEKRTREILEGSDFAGGDVKFILDALSDNSPDVGAWEEFIEARNQ